MTDPRLDQAAALLANRGFAGARVSADGPEGEIAAVAVHDDDWERLMADDALAAEIRALGFRYVALDLQPASG